MKTATIIILSKGTYSTPAWVLTGDDQDKRALKLLRDALADPDFQGCTWELATGVALDGDKEPVTFDLKAKIKTRSF